MPSLKNRDSFNLFFDAYIKIYYNMFDGGHKQWEG